MNSVFFLWAICSVTANKTQASSQRHEGREPLPPQGNPGPRAHPPGWEAQPSPSLSLILTPSCQPFLPCSFQQPEIFHSLKNPLIDPVYLPEAISLLLLLPPSIYLSLSLSLPPSFFITKLDLESKSLFHYHSPTHFEIFHCVT